MNDIYYIDVYASLYFDKKDGRGAELKSKIFYMTWLKSKL